MRCVFLYQHLLDMLLWRTELESERASCPQVPMVTTSLNQLVCWSSGTGSIGLRHSVSASVSQSNPHGTKAVFHHLRHPLGRQGSLEEGNQ